MCYLPAVLLRSLRRRGDEVVGRGAALKRVFFSFFRWKRPEHGCVADGSEEEKRRGWTLRRGRRTVTQSPEDMARWDEEHTASSEAGKRVWRNEEREVSGKKKMGSWNSCLIVSNFFDVRGKADG